MEIKYLGHSVVGHVLDVRRKPLERALKAYDPQLYLKWNPDKNNGNGIWEVRRTPNQLTSVYKCDYQGHGIFQLEAVEDEMVNHIMDVPFLNYNILTRLKEMDAWANPNLIENNDKILQERKEQKSKQNRDEMRYQIKHHKQVFDLLREHTRAGKNPLKYMLGKYLK